jgi:hypothetical protein
MTVSEHLERALATFGPNGEHWTKGNGTLSPQRPFYCTLSAIAKLYLHKDKDEYVVARIKARKYLGSALGNPKLADWNDNPNTTWNDVKALFEKAISLAKQNEIADRK